MSPQLLNIKNLSSRFINRYFKTLYALGHIVMIGIFAGALAFQSGVMASSMGTPTPEIPKKNTKIYAQFQDVSSEVSKLEQIQATAGVRMPEVIALEQKLAAIQVEIIVGKKDKAERNILDLRKNVANKQKALLSEIAKLSAPAAPAAGKFNIPILLYHKTPTDFENQLSVLEQRGYTTISLDEMVAAFHGRYPLPPKPVIITFDDGFSNQSIAVESLTRRKMKATFYIIDAGEASGYCIGAGRRPAPCGDGYLTWDQVRSIDANPLFTIASHTIDHLDLLRQTPGEQRRQVFEGKRLLEAQLGHEVLHLAYPYGSFDATIVELVKQAGFVTAVTTVPGTVQLADSPFTLRRIRDTYGLP